MAVALSFGGGRQTTAMVVLMAQGEIPRADLVVFADTGGELPETYDYIHRHMRPLLEKIEIPFHVVKGSERGYDDLYDWFWHYSLIPTVMYRNCSEKWKVKPIFKLLEQKGITREWIGFSANERGRAARALDNKRRRKYDLEFPLIEHSIDAMACENIIQRFGLPAPLKSACYYCAFQNPNRARRLYRDHPDLFEKVGLLEDRAIARRKAEGKLVYYLIGNKPWRSWAVVQGDLFGKDWEYGCQDGYCFR